MLLKHFGEFLILFDLGFSALLERQHQTVRAGKREEQMARDLKLKAFAYDGNITVDEDDLLAAFGERVRISLGWNQLMPTCYCS